uniref:Reverse transcriptase/retrotransposon-derived protein RNase H-like domain-containing protein n=1 Tax=Nicotiana tabacum TaxID=4097 RepID=A0A1S4CMX5_TOBAC|nr:PREDICTED: uncharacterized protein LOC107820800 [Nicotiana tabacum]
MPFYGAKGHRLLEKDVTFKFDEACLKAFEELKEKLVATPIIVAPDWYLSFEFMCDASDHAIGEVLAKRKDKMFYSIYYASKTLDELKNHEYAEEGGQIKETFPDEQLFSIIHDPDPWYADYTIYLPNDEEMHPEKEVELVLYNCHAYPYRVNYGGDRATAKVL